jgi:hypothetical protein
LTYNAKGHLSDVDRMGFWSNADDGVGGNNSVGVEIDNPDIFGNGRNVVYRVVGSNYLQTSSATHNGGTVETNSAFGLLSTPTAFAWYFNEAPDGGVTFNNGPVTPPTAQTVSIANECFGMSASSLYPFTVNYFRVWQQPFVSSIHAFGDSLGDQSLWGFTTWPGVVQTNQSLATLVNNAIRGQTARTAVHDEVISNNFGRPGNENPQDTNNPIYVTLLGTNDANTAEGTAVYTGCYESMLAWLGTPKSHKVFAQNSGRMKSGSWSNDNTTAQPRVAMVSTTSGNSIACTIIVGQSGVLYGWYYQCNPLGGGCTPISMTYAIDGGSPTTIGNTNANNSNTFVIVKATGLSPSSHTVTWTLGGNGNATIAGVGTPFGTACCRILVEGIPHKYVNGTTCNNDAVTGTYDAAVQALIGTLQLEGLAVTYAPVRLYLNDTTDMQDGADCLHPNATGQDHIAQAFGVIWP